MKKQYICPAILVVKLHTTKNLMLLNVSTEGEKGTVNSYDDDYSGEVWTKENKSIWDEEW